MTLLARFILASLAGYFAFLVLGVDVGFVVGGCVACWMVLWE